jgi:hypothetical protein
VLWIFSKWEKLNWRSLAKASQTCISLRRTGLSGVHRTVSGAQAGTLGEKAALGKKTGRCGYNSPDCPVGHEASGWQRSPSPNKEENRALFTVRWCTGLSGAPTDRRQPEPSKWNSNGPSCLGAIKGTPRRMEQDTKHPLNILQRLDFASAHLIHCDRDLSTFLSCDSVALFCVLSFWLVCVLLLRL